MTTRVFAQTPSALPPKKLWWAAIKPPMYSVAVMPIGVGSAIAFHETHRLNGAVLATFLISAVLILAWENLSNDVFDSETGVDVNKFNSVVNITGNKALIFWLANGLLGLGLLGISAIAFWQQDLTVIGLVLAWLYLSGAAVSAELPGAGRTAVLCGLWAPGVRCRLL
jgi:2-carboxy-1,4-naphthoquinone phytyltransferase